VTINFPTADQTAAYSPERLISQACRVLAHRGLAEDILGHVSLRDGEMRSTSAAAARTSAACCSRTLTTSGSSAWTATARCPAVTKCPTNCPSTARCCAPPSLPPRDIAEFPNLGGMFNDEFVWRSYVARLALDGLAV